MSGSSDGSDGTVPNMVSSENQLLTNCDQYQCALTSVFESIDGSDETVQHIVSSEYQLHSNVINTNGP